MINDRQGRCIQAYQLLKILILAFLFSACNNSPEKSTIAPREPEKFKVRSTQSSLDQVYDIEVVPLGSVRSRSLSNPVKTLRVSNQMVAGEPVRLQPIIPITTTPGEGQYKEPEVVPVIDSPRTGRLAPSTAVGDPQLRDENPAGFGSYNTLHGLRINLPCIRINWITSGWVPLAGGW